MTAIPIQLEFPLHVSQIKVDGQDQYLIKPLFFSHTSIVHRRFDSALSRMKVAIQGVWKGVELDRDTITQLYWFKFNPKIDYRVYDLEIPLKGKNFRTGKFGIALFEIQNLTIACLPHFKSFMFMIEKNERGKIDIKTLAPPIISKLLKLYEAQDPEDFNFENFVSSPKEFTTIIKIKIQGKNLPFGFASQSPSIMFDLFGGSDDMEGSSEIWNIGKNLNGVYPTGLNRAFYQEEMVSRLGSMLFSSPYKNTPIAIVGKEGVGKETIVHEVLRRDLEIKTKGKHHRSIWHIDPTRIITGMSIVGMWQKRMEAVLEFLKSPYGTNKGADVMLVNNAVAMLHIGKSAQNNMTVNDVLKPYLEKREVQLVILATPEEWKIIQEKDRRFADLFQIIRLDEPDLPTAVKMTLENRKVLEVQNECVITVKAIQAVFDFRRNFLKRQALPGSVIKIIRQLSVKYRGNKIDVPEVRAEFENYSGLSENIFDASQAVEQDAISNEIAKELVGQQQAVSTLANVVHTMKARLTAPDKPMGSFMFIGPTGVGKTQAAKVLSKYLTGSEERLMQFDMNEFIDDTAVQRLIGNAQNPEGQLTGRVRYQPFGIVLLDEIEKAHPKVLDLLLQILDDARLTDSLGRTIDFSNTIIIMTSNVGASQVSSQAGFKTAAHDESAIYQKAVENNFRPEFVNRIDEIVIFKPLEMQHIMDIAWLQIKDLLSRDGFVRRTTILNIAPDALEWVARRGFDARMGGRALKRQIEKDLTVLTASQLVSTYTSNPILFEIFLENNNLIPKITPLQFIKALEDQWFPALPEATKGKGFYTKLIRSLEAIERRIDRMESRDREAYAIVDFSRTEHFSFKEKIAETKERLTNLSLGFRDKKFHLELAAPLRLKRSTLWNDYNDKILKENYKDYFFQQEGLAEINEVYHRTNVQYNSLQTEFLNSYLEVAFLKLFARDFLKNNTQKVTLRLESCINNAGEAQIKFLCTLYEKLLDYLNIEMEVDEDQQFIIADGYALISLLQGETGIHLFPIPYQNPVPIRVILEAEDYINEMPDYQVIRVYDRPNTLTDFRTNFTNAVNITVEEFSLLVYAGIEVEVRRGLVG
ncbi:MAG: AAA family ATPase [Bacteroidota bacterium]